MTRTTVRLWVDPGCPWAWQGAVWLRRLADAGVVELDWHIFSLELNSSEMDAPFWEACARHGESLVAIALARREGNGDSFDGSIGEIGRRLHDEKLENSPALVRDAAAAAGMPDLVDRAIAIPNSRTRSGQSSSTPDVRACSASDVGDRRPAGRLRAGLRARAGRRGGRSAVGARPVADATARLLRDEAMAAGHPSRERRLPETLSPP